MTNPIVLVSEFSHFAFDKAADIAGATIIRVPCDSKKKLNLLELRKYINWYGRRNIAAIGVAAPNYPNGMPDDIEGAGKIALENGIPCHVDACLGGFVSMFCEDAARADFSCEGVTSICVDAHKYGLTGKGSSICVFRKSSPALPTMQYITHEAGVYVTQGISGSTRGEAVLELYAMLTTLGKDKWAETSRGIIKATRDLAREVNKIPGVRVLGNAEELTCGLAVELDPEFWKGKKAPDIHAIGDELATRLGAGFQYILGGFHLTLANNHVANPAYIANFPKYLKEITETIGPEVKPTSSVGSAYFAMKQTTIFGLPVLPAAISKRIAEAAVTSIYDFRPEAT